MNKNLARVLDIELNVSVILGRTKMALKDIFELGKGSLIELDTFENQEVEIYVNGRKIRSQVKLKDMDEIRFGTKSVVIRQRRRGVRNV